MAWATFWATFQQTHLVTQVGNSSLFLVSGGQKKFLTAKK
jgi:hypothetical protein